MRSARRDRRSVRSRFNEDASTIVLTPFSGRVTRLIAKVGDQVKSGDPLLEIDSPEQVPPQNDFIAAHRLQKAKRAPSSTWRRSSRSASAICMKAKAAPFKDLQQAEAQLAAAENDMRSTDTAFEAARIRLRILGRTDAEISKLEQTGTLSRVTTDHGADRRHRHLAQGRAGTTCQGRFRARLCMRSPTCRRCG